VSPAIGRRGIPGVRVLEWIAQDRVDAEAAADRPVIEALHEAGHESMRILPTSSEGDPAQPIRETAGLRRLPWTPHRAAWFEGGEVDAICEFHRGRGIDLVWARGRSAWSAAIRAAARLEAPLWIELGSIVEAGALARIPRNVDVLLTVATSAETEHLRGGLASRLLLTAEGGPLIVPPAMAAPRRHADGARDRRSKIVIVNPGRRPNAAAVHLVGTLIERVQAWNRHLHSASPRDGTNAALVEIFIEDPLAGRPAIRRLLARLDADVPTPRNLEEATPSKRVVRVPPLGRCRGAIGEGDAVVAPQALLRQRPAVIEAVAAGAIFVSPRDPELADWFGNGVGGLELPRPGHDADSGAVIDELLETLATPGRRHGAAEATRRLGTLLDPATRTNAVRETFERVSGPHRIAFFLPTPDASPRPTGAR